MKHLNLLLPAVLSGLLLGITTIGHGPVYHLHWAIFFGFVPLWATWMKGASAKEIFLSGWLAQFMFTLVAFHWLAYTVNEFSHMGAVPSLLVMLLYCCIANLQFPAAGLLWHFFYRRSSSVPLKIAALALLTALCQRIGTTIFHWNFGYAWLYMGWPGMQLADFFGFRFLCTLSICLNAFFAFAWIQRARGGWRKPLVLAALCFGLINFAGWLHLKQLPPPDSLARALVIQPNIGNRDKERLEHGDAFRPVALRRYFAITDRALATVKEPSDFALWPENAFPDYIVDPNLGFGLALELKKYLKERKLNLLTGSFGGSSEGKLTNAIFALTKEGIWASPPYVKTILLPFGEYIPGAETFPFLKDAFPDVRDYAAGKGPILLQLGSLKLGAQICYEGLFDSISRNLANLGAQIILNITNDSWYGNWMEPWQHFYITMAKAVETRRPLLRGTNTGLSAVILADGTIPAISPISQEWFSLVDIPYRAEPPVTLFMRWGYYFDWLFLGAGLLLLFIFRRPPSTVQ